MLIAASSVGLLGPACAELLLLERGRLLSFASYNALEGDLRSRGMVSARPAPAAVEASDASVNSPQALAAKADGECDADGGDSKLERAEIGKINSSVYRRYLSSIGPLLCSLVVISTLLMQVSSNLIGRLHLKSHALSLTANDIVPPPPSLLVCLLVRSGGSFFQRAVLGNQRRARRGKCDLRSAALLPVRVLWLESRTSAVRWAGALCVRR